jgi:hypothetical protein
MGFAEMMEGPRTKINRFDRKNWMTQVGWIGHKKGKFYPWPSQPTETEEPGGYSPVYMEDGD